MRITRSGKKILLGIAAVVLVVGVCIAAYLAGGRRQMLPEDYPLNVFFFDVGEGDCELLRCEDVNVLIDGGEVDCAYKTEQYLRACGVETIDCYILTHPHSDHIGAASHIISSFTVSQVMTTAFTELNLPTTKAYDDMLSAVEAAGTELLHVSGGQSYDFGPLHLDILSPLADTDDYNDMSITVRAAYKSRSFLLMGDASSAVEAQLLNADITLQSNVLKTGHHGSDSATSEPFLKAAAPDYAVISCGAGNLYGHPSPQTLNLLMKYEAEILRTDVNGTIQFYGNGKKLFVKTAA